MPDLAVQIRERLDRLDEDLTSAITYGPVEVPMVALHAVLELHTPTDDGSGLLTVCGVCCGPSESWERLALPWPCPTVRAVATALGIEET